MSHSSAPGELAEDSDLDFTHLLACVFGIRDHERRTYLTLHDHPGSTVEELASVLDRDRSNVNRSLSTLQQKGLLERKRRLLDSGGYVYQYTAVDIEEARAMLHAALDEWVDSVHDEIDQFGATVEP
ncbi:MarR family transcriptional regulator [Halonotius sp. F2-221B]|uniref:helix-turn-helix domain-containing protein n=1 Tax=Halonotius sp. F2-221B TaxID=2731620 RepID=UPI00398B325F